MNKSELIADLAKKSGETEAASKRVLDAFTEIVGEQLKANNEVSLTGFGKFYCNTRKARKGRNPQTGESLQIPAKEIPKFKAGKTLKEITNTL